MTQSKEDYLKIIYEAELKNVEVNNKYIMKELGVSAASVSEMLKKLEKDGFVEYVPYRNIVITEQGRLKAIALVRKHRLWEVFLLRHLGFSWSEVHDEAERLEHVTSETMLERMDAFLSYPEICPHGGKIPRENDYTPEIRTIPLSNCQEGQVCKIMRVPEDKNILEYLSQIGLGIGEVFQIKEIGQFEGMFVLKNELKEVSISYKVACELFVSVECTI